MAQRQRFVLGIDLDGVCADFINGLRPIAAEWLGVDINDLTESPTYGFKEWNLSTVGGDEAYEHLHRYAITQRDLFQNLPIIPGSGVAIRRLSHKYGVRERWRRFFEQPIGPRYVMTAQVMPLPAAAG